MIFLRFCDKAGMGAAGIVHDVSLHCMEQCAKELCKERVALQMSS